ncbi:UTP--glucose-1-phosphate uridylyltransferase [Roseibacterium sp. SDUM158017]|uniref:UTP--glucose-1-phosphate uridylyltransferase n=1 Tax=Roseicyclus salinarum TaxID=3036773 RepID=UPI002414EA09|nr:UTP--glucose-1-phosphate uridylyltransferase [Roseibacterium sp. SDUM158017]MDG4647780.1 UTP--glucose-1-phosphate uridylyltransferase [Roseibacterium sp. SDUM158017]
MTASVRTAIFPVAGLGTRFLPATKATPKELLPVIDTPLIQYAVDEARHAGIERMVFVSHPTKSAIERHVMDDEDLRAELRARGKAALADELAETSLCPVEDDVIFTMQDQPLGLGHAVLCARDHVLPGPVAVVLPDDLILGEPGALSEMIAAYAAGHVGHLVATMTVPRSETGKYGILSVTGRDGQLLLADGMVEKPAPADAPSTEAVVGRYILDASIFDALETQEPGAGGEIQLTDAIARSARGIGMAGFRFSGQRFDCGSKPGMLAATLHLAAKDPEYAEVLAQHGVQVPQVRAA